MINSKLLFPKSIAVIGGSNDVRKPGGKVLLNLLEGNYQGNLVVLNPKEATVQGVPSFARVEDLPEVDLAIIAIAAKYIPDTVRVLTQQKNTGGFIILSAGFSEESEEGKQLEQQVIQLVEDAGASLIGPNCIGVLTPDYHGVFTRPIPKLTNQGCDFISGSGATACFIMESGIPKGLPFARVFSVGNSAQIGVEEVLEYMDETYDPGTSSSVKLLYIETIQKPQKLLKHAQSLIAKGCRIAAVKSGGSEAGSRAASSHTGALASSDVAVDSLFAKAGIVRCSGREELTAVASVFMYPELKGKRIAIVTHAGGPAVMLTDALSNGGLEVPPIGKEKASDLLAELFPGSSVENPIDFLATGTAEQLATIIDYVNELDDIDGMIVIFGTAGLDKVNDAYRVIDEKLKIHSKPIYPVLPSIVTAAEEIKEFTDRGRVYFPDEVVLGNALAKIIRSNDRLELEEKTFPVDIQKIREVVERADNGYLGSADMMSLLDAAGIPRAGEAVVTSSEEAQQAAKNLGYPVVMKVVGPVHKSDVGGVVLHVDTPEKVAAEFERMIQIPETTAILLQPMLSGLEIFAGAKREDTFGHLLLSGLGGIFIEVFKDVKSNLVPLSYSEAIQSIRGLKSYPLIKGVRGQKGINQEAFAEILVRLSNLLEAAPEIFEMDLNPLLGTPEKIIAVDARIRIEK